MAVLLQQSTTEALGKQQNTIGAFGKLCWYSRVLLEHSVCCVGIE